MLRPGQRLIEDFDDLSGADLPRVVFDLHAAFQRASFVSLHAEHAHQLALNGLAQDAFAIQHGIVKSGGSNARAVHPPTGDATGETLVTHDAPPVPRGRRRRHSQVLTVIVGRRGGKRSREPIQDALAAVLLGVEMQIDGRRPVWGDDGRVDGGRQHRPLQKAPTKIIVWRAANPALSIRMIPAPGKET